jgi:hypothetical protein
VGGPLVALCAGAATNRTAGRGSAGDAGMAPRGVDAIAEWEVLWLHCAQEQ